MGFRSPIGDKPAMRASLIALVSLRVAVGVLFLIFAEYKVVGTRFTLGGGMESWIHRFLQDGAYPFMVPLLRGFVLPHARSVALVVAYGELALGLSLAFGILVRPASVFGLLYMLALLFSSNYPGCHAAFWQYFGASLDHSVLAMCFAAFAFAKPDAILSLRRWLSRLKVGRGNDSLSNGSSSVMEEGE